MESNHDGRRAEREPAAADRRAAAPSVAVPRTSSGTWLKTIAATTASGTSRAGRMNSIGANASSVGITTPLPTSNWIRRRDRIADDQQREARPAGAPRCVGSTAAKTPATAR